MYKLLIINPGSTSTKVAVFNDKEQVFKKTSSILSKIWLNSIRLLTSSLIVKK